MNVEPDPLVPATMPVLSSEVVAPSSLGLLPANTSPLGKEEEMVRYELLMLTHDKKHQCSLLQSPRSLLSRPFLS